MRTFELLNTLSKKDMLAIGDIVAGKKKKSLRLLYSELLKCKNKNQEPDNEKLFEHAFGSKYSKQNDYLLRNELRLLNDIIYDYLIADSFKSELNKNPSAYYQWLLKSFYTRGLNSFFEAEIETGIALGLADVRPEDTSVMLSTKSLWQIQNQPRSAETMKQQLEVIRQWKHQEKRRFFFRIREAEARETFIQLVLDSIENKRDMKNDDERTDGQTVFDLSGIENSDWRARYLLLKKHSSQTKKEVRIKVLKQMYQIEQAPYFKGDYSFNAQIVSLVNIAHENILMDNFEEADKYMQESISRCEQRKHPIPIGNIQNYVAIQAVLKRFEKGIEVYKKYERQIAKSRSVINIAILASFCHLFLKQPDEAISLIPASAKMTPDNVVVSRLIYAIVFFLRGDFSLAYNECTNLKRAAAVNIVEKKNDIYTLIIQWITKYFAAFTKDAATKQNEITELREILGQQQALISPHLKKEFALLWLVNEVLGRAPVWSSAVNVAKRT